jgi:type I restriction-modification system DNA methylase subunit
MTIPTIDLAPLRDVIRAIGELPEGKVSDPLALLEMRIRHALAAYDASEEVTGKTEVQAYDRMLQELAEKDAEIAKLKAEIKELEENIRAAGDFVEEV